MTAGQVSNYIGAAALLGSLPMQIGYSLTGDLTPIGKEELKQKGIKPGVPGR